MLPKGDLAQPSPFFYQNAHFPIISVCLESKREEERTDIAAERLFAQAPMRVN